MQDQVKKDINQVLQDAIKSIKSESYTDLHSISDHLVHSMTVYQEQTTLDCSIVIYSLSKIFEKEKYVHHEFMPDFKYRVIDSLKLASQSILKQDMQSYRQAMNQLKNIIKKFDQKMHLFEKPILEFARIQKASKLIEHGLSAGRVAEYVGIPEWELTRYVGHTAAPEISPAEPTSNKSRVELVKRLFKI